MAKLHGVIDLNRNLKKFRKDNGLSIRKAAALSGLATPSAWKHYEDKCLPLPLGRFIRLLSNLTKDKPEEEHRDLFWTMFDLLDNDDREHVMDVGRLMVDALYWGHDEAARVQYEIDHDCEISADEWAEMNAKSEHKAKPKITRTVTLTIDENLQVTNVERGYVQ